MKAVRENRTIRIVGLPESVEGCTIPAQLEIEIRYTGDSNAFKGIALDNVVLPIIVKALNRNVKPS